MDKKNKCDTCDQAFATKRSADQHMDDTGHRILPFKCEICDKRFRLQEFADQHMGATGHRKSRSENNLSHVLQSPPVDKTASSGKHPASRQSTNKTKKKPSNHHIETRTSLIFPSLHQDVANAVATTIGSVRFHANCNDMGFVNEYSTNIMGSFKCNNNACPKKVWTSGKIAILIRGYPGNRYSAEVFNQSCKSCKRLGTMSLDKQSYVERIEYRLKKWAGVPTGRQTYSLKNGPPHEERLCEGCKRGICRFATD